MCKRYAAARWHLRLQDISFCPLSFFSGMSTFGDHFSSTWQLHPLSRLAQSATHEHIQGESVITYIICPCASASAHCRHSRIFCYRCPNPAACQGNRAALQGCSQDAACRTSVSYHNLQCSAAYTGNVCGACSLGYGVTKPLHCRACMSTTAIIVMYLTGGLVMLAFIKLVCHFTLAENFQS
jgi:hypothetical protein